MPHEYFYLLSEDCWSAVGQTSRYIAVPQQAYLLCFPLPASGVSPTSQLLG